VTPGHALDLGLGVGVKGANKTDLTSMALGSPMIETVQRDIIEGLGKRSERKALARRLALCQTGTCNACGDACAINARRWKNANFTKIANLFAATDGASVFEVRIQKQDWSRQAAHLVGAVLSGIEKGTRRALDDLRLPGTLAVGQMDAWWVQSRWVLGTRMLIVGPSKQELYKVLARFSCEVAEVADVAKVLTEQLETLHFPKKLRALSVSNEFVKRTRRVEYYEWLYTLKAGSRIFRYGCNRYWQKLEKRARPMQVKVKKGHPLPRWLERYQYGNHPRDCQCVPCGGPGLHYNRPPTRRASKAESKRYFDDV
jgi:hypothetical protein